MLIETWRWLIKLQHPGLGACSYTQSQLVRALMYPSIEHYYMVSNKALTESDVLLLFLVLVS